MDFDFFSFLVELYVPRFFTMKILKYIQRLKKKKVNVMNGRNPKRSFRGF